MKLLVKVLALILLVTFLVFYRTKEPSEIEQSVGRILCYGGIPLIVWDENRNEIIFKQDNTMAGTGFVIFSSDSSSLILTDAHVLYFYAPSGRPIQAKRVVCWFRRMNIRVEAKILEMDHFLDLALLEIPVPNLPSLELALGVIEETDVDKLGTAGWLIGWPGQRNDFVIKRVAGKDAVEEYQTASFFSGEMARFSLGDTLAVSERGDKRCHQKILILKKGDQFINLNTNDTAILDTAIILPLASEVFLTKKICVFDQIRLTEDGIIKTEELVYFLAIKDRSESMQGTSGGPLLDKDGKVIGIQQRDFLSVGAYHFLARGLSVRMIRGFLEGYIE